jgi:hypothetical protein
MFGEEALEEIRENIKLEFHYNNCFTESVAEQEDEVSI